ncbi:MAG: hypothetical protein ACXWQO_17325 [Bdellovibrionota bacterium]
MGTKKKSAKTGGGTSKSSNVTNLKLANLPFKTAKAHKEAQDQLRLQVWRRLEEAKILHEMLELDEYKFWHEEFEHGLNCEFMESNDSSLVKVHSRDKGINITINKGLAVSTPLSEAVLGNLIKAMSESFARTYYTAKGLMVNAEPAEVKNKEK